MLPAVSTSTMLIGTVEAPQMIATLSRSTEDEDALARGLTTLRIRVYATPKTISTPREFPSSEIRDATEELQRLPKFIQHIRGCIADLASKPLLGYNRSEKKWFTMVLFELISFGEVSGSVM